MTAIRSPRQLRKGFSLSISLSLFLLSLALLSIYPRNHIGKYGVQLKAIQRDHFGHVHRHGKHAGRRDRKEGSASFIFPNTNLIAVLKRLICLAFAIGVLLYYVKSLSSLADARRNAKIFRGYCRIVHSTDSSSEPRAPRASMAIESTPHCAEIK